MTSYASTVASYLPIRTSDKIADELRRMIITLELPPGAVVSEAFLTERLTCGRTPLREAVQRLAHEHLLVSIPKIGVSVAGLNMLEFAEMSDLLLILGNFAARQAAERITAAQLAELEEIVTRAEQARAAGDFSATAELDVNFHRVIAEATGNRYVADTMTFLHRLVTRFSHVVWQRQGDDAAGHSLAEHRGILAALQNRDADEAERLTGEHNHNARERVRAAL
jgi:DNA-binding GntR family transcriptional regulator